MGKLRRYRWIWVLSWGLTLAAMAGWGAITAAHVVHHRQEPECDAGHGGEPGDCDFCAHFEFTGADLSPPPVATPTISSLWLPVPSTRTGALGDPSPTQARAPPIA